MRLAIFSQDPVIGEALACLLAHTGAFEVVANFSNLETGLFALQAQRPDLIIFTEDFEGHAYRLAIRQLKQNVGAPAMLIHAKRTPVAERDAEFDFVQSRWPGVGALCQSIRSVAGSPATAMPTLAAPSSDPYSRSHRLASLSARERETVELLVKGMDNAQIARSMGLSEPTVKLYVSRLLRIFGVKNRVQLVLLATGHEQAMESVTDTARVSE